MSNPLRTTLRDWLTPPEGTSLEAYACVRGLRWLGRQLAGQPNQSIRGVTTRDCTLTGVDTSVDIRIYEPSPDTGPTTATVFLHGGGWISGDLDTNPRLCSLLAEESGRAVIAVDYRLAPEHRYPAALRDCAHVLDWIATDGPAYGIDPEAVRLFGTSAGGTLAAALTADPATEYPLSIAQQTLIYPPLDPAFDDRHSDTGLLRRVARPVIQGLWKLYLPRDADGTEPRVAPLRATCFETVPPTTVVTCGLDPLRAEGRTYARTLDAAGVPVTHIDFHRLPHGFLTLLPRLSRRRTLTALRRILDATADRSN